MSSRKTPLQSDKDEQLLTLYTFAALHHLGPKAISQLLENSFPNEGWSAYLSERGYTLELEKAVSPQAEVLNSLKEDASKHPVKYVRELIEGKKLEGSTHFDAYIKIGSKKIFIECKFTSDISYDTTHCTHRNQIARCVDIGLQEANDNVDNFYFILITPSAYRELKSRLYAFKMEEYCNEPYSLSKDVPRLKNWLSNNGDTQETHQMMERVSEKIKWLHWEECASIIMKYTSDNYLKKQLKKFYSDRILLP